jgi:hypothetical protein
MARVAVGPGVGYVEKSFVSNIILKRVRNSTTKQTTTQNAVKKN